jgi:hypothetical protein
LITEVKKSTADSSFQHITHTIFTGHLAVSVLIGALFGAFWLSLWWFYGIPAISTLLVTLTLGYLVAATIFFSGAGMY